MRPVVDGDELIEGDVRVALGRRQARMTQKLLNGAQIRAPLEQVGRAGVAERVRMEIAAAGAERAVAPNQGLDAPDAEPSAVSAEEQRARVLTSRARMTEL